MDNLKILLQAVLDQKSSKKVKDDLKKVVDQLNAGKDVGEVSIGVNTDTQKLNQTTKRIRDLIDEYKLGIKTAKEFDKAGTEIAQSTDFQNAKTQDKIRLLKELQGVEKLLTQQENERIQTSNKQTDNQIQKEKQLRDIRVQAENAKLDNAIKQRKLSDDENKKWANIVGDSVGQGVTSRAEALKQENVLLENKRKREIQSKEEEAKRINLQIQKEKELRDIRVKNENAKLDNDIMQRKLAESENKKWANLIGDAIGEETASRANKLHEENKLIDAQIKKQRQLKEEVKNTNQQKFTVQNKLYTQKLREQDKAANLSNFQSKFSNQIDNMIGGSAGKYLNKDGLESLRKQVNELTTSMPNLNRHMQKASNQLSDYNAKAQNAARSSMNLVDSLKEALIKYPLWVGVATLVSGSFRAIGEGVKYIYDMDNALNQIRIVTGQSQEDVEKLATSYNKLGKEMGVTTKEIAATSVELYRQGLGADEVNERMQSIIKYAKISGISLEESNKIITATGNATGESVEKIIDVFSQLGDKTASGADEIGEAMQKVAGTAESMHLPFEQAAAWIATISSKTRENAAIIGNSLKSMMSRYGAIKAKGYNDDDPMKLNDVVKALKEAKVVAVDSQGQLRNFGDVINELMGKWQGLGENTKRYVATAVAGNFQMNRFLTLMENSEDAMKNYDLAMQAAGNANKKFNIYQESAQSKMDKFKASVEDFWQKSLSSSLMKGFIDGLTWVIDLLSRAGGIIPILAGVLSGLLVGAIMAVRAGVTILNVELTKTNILMGGLPILIGLVVTGVTAFGMASLNSATATDEFNKTLEVQTRSYEELKTAQDNAKKQAGEWLAQQQGEVIIATRLTSKLQELSEKTNKTTYEKAQMAQIVDKLNRVLPDLNLNYNKETGTLNKQIGVVQEAINAYRELLLVKASEKVAGESAGRLYESQINIDRAKAQKEKFVKEAAPMGESIRQGLLTGQPNKNIDYNRYNLLLDSIKTLDKTINDNLHIAYQSDEDIKKAFSMSEAYAKKFPQKVLDTDKGVWSNEPTDSDKTKGSGSAEIDEPNALLLADRYFLVNREIEKYQALIEKSKAMGENAELKDKNKYITQQIELYKELQKATANKAKVTRGEREELISSLSQPSVGGVFSGSGDDAFLSNAKQILQTKLDEVNSHRKDKNKDIYNRLKNEYDDLKTQIDRFFDIQSKELPNLSQEWWKYAKSIGDSRQSMEDVHKDVIKNFKDAQKTITDILEKEIEKRKDKIEKEFDELSDSVSDVLEEIDRKADSEDYDKSVEKQQDKIMDIVKKKASLLLAAKSGDLEAMSQLKDLQEEEKEAREDLEDTQKDRSRDLVKQNLQDFLDKEKKLKDLRISQLDEINNETSAMAATADALFKQTINGFELVLTKFLEKMGIAKDEAKQIMGNIKPQVDSIYTAQKSSVTDMKTLGITSKTVSSVANMMENTNLHPLAAQMASVNPTTGLTDWKKYINNKYNATMEYQKTGVWNSATQLQAKAENDAIRATYKIPDNLTWDEVQRIHSGFATGGINTQPGMYPLHGTRTKPEFIFTYDQMKSFLGSYSGMMSVPNPKSSVPNNSNSMGVTLQIDKLIDIQGNVTPDVMSELNGYANKIVDMTMNRIKTQINKSGQVRFL